MKKLLVLAPLILLPLYAVQITKANLIDKISIALPEKFCETNQPSRQCFKVSAQQCKSVAKSAILECIRINYSKISNILNMQQAQSVSYMIGNCAGIKYSKKLENRLDLKSKGCNL